MKRKTSTSRLLCLGHNEYPWISDALSLTYCSTKHDFRNTNIALIMNAATKWKAIVRIDMWLLLPRVIEISYSCWAGWEGARAQREVVNLKLKEITVRAGWHMIMRNLLMPDWLTEHVNTQHRAELQTYTDNTLSFQIILKPMKQHDDTMRFPDIWNEYCLTPRSLSEYKESNYWDCKNYQGWSLPWQPATIIRSPQESSAQQSKHGSGVQRWVRKYVTGYS